MLTAGAESVSCACNLLRLSLSSSGVDEGMARSGLPLASDSAFTPVCHGSRAMQSVKRDRA